MKEIRGEILEEKLILHFSGHVDSNNAPAVEEEINKLLADAQGKEVSIDAKDLEYISSAGLRVLLHIRKSNPNLHISNVSSEIYEILDMTGFTQMMQVEKAYRVVSIEGCEEIGRGANGTIYRIDKDNVVKVYNNADALADIQHEREVARKALVLGIPTAISYDVVKVGESYGSVFELLNARSFSKIIATEPDKLDWCVKEYVDMLRKIHGTLVPKGDLPDLKETAVGWAKFVQDYLPEQYGKKLLNLITAIPHDDHMIHGDYHTKNLELTGDEVLLIDMDTLSVGEHKLAVKFDDGADATAAEKSEEKKELTIFAVNRTLDKNVEFSADIRSFGDSKLIGHLVLENNDLKAVNSSSEEKVAPSTSSETKVDGGEVTSVLHPASWNVIRISLV